MIHFYHVTKRFDRYSTALHDVTFHIEKGEFVFLTGASGAGKSTLLKLILRQMRPTDGQIVVNGRNLNAMKRSQIPMFRREIGFVFQDFKLIERMTVFENLAFILTVLNVPVLGISCITNMAAGILPQKLTHQEVMDTTARVQKQFTGLVLGVLSRLS